MQQRTAKNGATTKLRWDDDELLIATDITDLFLR